ncbi:MAG: HAMP domain-containing histidine kinase [Desulfovibrionaceae bacterium]|nr:HAMP domain-containing histidine kinase [Desulfovibrionaceae bacterium]
MNQSEAASREGLQFFGRVSASVSHEIKNVFAVINEAAGLIGDLTTMAERGMPIKPERLKRASDAIQGQIRRGDAIVKNMNAFAHSTDEDVREVNLGEILQLTLALTTRLADMKQIRLIAGHCEPVSLKANPFDLMRLLHSSIAAALDSLSAGDSLVVGVEPAGHGASFSLSAPGKDAPLANDEAFSALARSMGAAVSVDEASGTSLLRLRAAGTR